jgi:PHD/YefM family antitoxin component YafN of YafNO toxin-antitoxin module
MSKEGFKSVSPTRINLLQGGKRSPPTFKDKIEKMSGLVGNKEVSWACAFIKDTENSEKKRVAIIRSLKEATLIPATYEMVQGTLQRLLRDSSDAIKTAAKDVFDTHRVKVQKIRSKYPKNGLEQVV